MSSKPILRVLNGEAVWPPPVWLMRQAGRYLPEYRAIKDSSGGFIARCMTPELATEITLQPIRRFAMDAAILFSDILILPWALGQDVSFKDGVGPVLEPVRRLEAVERLSQARAVGALQPVLETVRNVRSALPGACTLIGFAGAPFTVACYMVEGGGSRDFAETKRMAFGEPALFGRLMDTLIEGSIAYLSAQIEAGAEAVMLFDTWAGMLSPSQFRLHVIEPARRIVEALNQRHPDVPVIGFPRLAGLYAGDYAERTGVDAVALDTGTDPRVAARGLAESVAIQGNLDPIALLVGGEAMRSETLSIVDGLAGRPHIFNLGHGILPQTNPDHVAELVAFLRSR
jgi:uroporphyrinogen decarboxylase